MISVRRGEIKDIPTIMQFLEDNWLHGYILPRTEFFDWQFVHEGKANIWIGIDDETGKLYAILSMIIYRDTPTPDVSGSIWIAIKSENPMLAFDLQYHMWNELRSRDTFSPGLHSDAVKANLLLGNPVVPMDHYYRLANRENYRITIVKNRLIPNKDDSGYDLLPCDTLEEMEKIVPEDTLIASALQKIISI